MIKGGRGSVMGLLECGKEGGECDGTVGVWKGRRGV